MNYKINLGAWNGVFAVPSAVVDKYILLASGSSIKVLLFLLRNCDREFELKDIALQLKMSDETVSDALSFWVQAGLLCDNNGVLTPPNADAEDAVAFIAEVNTKSVNVRKVEERKVGELSPAEIAERIEGSPQIKALFEGASKIMGKPLNHTDQRTMIRIADYLGMDTDIILMIVRYCKSIDRCSMKYVEAVATSWAEEGIVTHLDADKKLASLKKANKVAVKIKKAFGIERNLSKKENEYIEKWIFEYKMSFEMIEAAYQVMCNNGISKTSFAYMDKILMNWNEDNIHSVNEIPEPKKSKKQSDSDASYDLTEFEKQALFSTPNGQK